MQYIQSETIHVSHKLPLVLKNAAILTQQIAHGIPEQLKLPHAFPTMQPELPENPGLPHEISAIPGMPRKFQNESLPSSYVLAQNTNVKKTSHIGPLCLLPSLPVITTT